LAAALFATLGLSAAASPSGPQLTLSLAAHELTYGSAVDATGTLVAPAVPAATATVELQASAYPFSHYVTVARTGITSSGAFSFADIRPGSNTRLRAVLAGTPTITSPAVEVIVDPRVQTRSQILGLGRTLLSIRLEHPSFKTPGRAVARWYVAVPGSRTLRFASQVSARELSPGLLYANAVVTPPSDRFAYRVCIEPPWAPTMGPPALHGTCADPAVRAGSAFQFSGDGVGTAVAPYPSQSAIATATRFLDTRAGATAFAVDNNYGQLFGTRVREHFQTASVVKVMMLVAYLQMLSAQHRSVDPADNSLLYPMIHISDNEAASAVYSIVGAGAVARVAREAGMGDYAPGVGWWAYTQTSAADQANFFFALPRLIPPQFYAYARGLLAGIEPSQSWGIPPVARPTWQVFFKTGALPSEGLFNEVARLERPGVTITIAVFTSGDPSMAYGEETIQGVGAALIGQPPTALPSPRPQATTKPQATVKP
jgi:hypothetical protein